MKNKAVLCFAIIIFLLLVGCNLTEGNMPTATPSPTPVPSTTPTTIPSNTPALTDTTTVTPSPTPTSLQNATTTFNIHSDTPQMTLEVPAEDESLGSQIHERYLSKPDTPDTWEEVMAELATDFRYSDEVVLSGGGAVENLRTLGFYGLCTEVVEISLGDGVSANALVLMNTNAPDVDIYIFNNITVDGYQGIWTSVKEEGGSQRWNEPSQWDDLVGRIVRVSIPLFITEGGDFSNESFGTFAGNEDHPLWQVVRQIYIDNPEGYIRVMSDPELRDQVFGGSHWQNGFASFISYVEQKNGSVVFPPALILVQP